MKIAIGNDHAAVDMKNIIKSYLEEKGYHGERGLSSVWRDGGKRRGVRKS